MIRLGCFVKAHHNYGKYRLDGYGRMWYRIAPFLWERAPLGLGHFTPNSFYKLVDHMEYSK